MTSPNFAKWEGVPNMSLSAWSFNPGITPFKGQCDTYKHTHEDGTVTIHHNGNDPALGIKHGDLVNANQ